MSKWVLWLVIVPIVVFAILMVMFPGKRWEILGVELVSPIPPIP